MSSALKDHPLVEAITLVRHRPAMYIDGASFERLHGFINGYLLGRGYPGGGDWRLLESFQVWLKPYAGVGAPGPWDRIIRFLSCKISCHRRLPEEMTLVPSHLHAENR